MWISKDIQGYLSVLAALASYVFYARSILAGRTRPHMFSWITWGLLTSMAFYAQFTNEAGPGAWGTGAVALFCFVVASMALFRGEKDIARIDWITFGAALGIIPVWYFTSNALCAVILIVLIDALGGYYPTFRKSYYKPHQEMLQLYVIGIFQLGLSLLAMERYYWVNILYPLFIIIANIALVGMVVWRRKIYAEKQ